MSCVIKIEEYTEEYCPIKTYPFLINILAINRKGKRVKVCHIRSDTGRNISIRLNYMIDGKMVGGLISLITSNLNLFYI